MIRPITRLLPMQRNVAFWFLKCVKRFLSKKKKEEEILKKLNINLS